MFKIEFDEPTNGWLPVTIRYQDCEEVLFASDIPFDPMSQLEDVLDSALTGVGGEVWWHLEPGGYYLSIKPEKECFHVRLDFSADSKATTREEVFDFVGTFDDVVVPLWRSLRKYQSYGYERFLLSDKVMKSITAHVKANRSK
ncbi:hypothetical protein A9Q99_08750 [Gammaproteobacteria bacterium 45_16_T64]|nr:hypothetical protein A9Q99_08750 [Gammaproteobacteria bacterium 45_16_T64]